jgi:hypothetical protein
MTGLGLAGRALRRDDLCMRMTPIIGQKAWFGPRRVGWGLAPISLEGWALTAVFAVLTSVAKKKRLARQPMQIMLGSFSVLVALKGTSPGGPRRRRAFDLERGRLSPSDGPQAG